MSYGVSQDQVSTPVGFDASRVRRDSVPPGDHQRAEDSDERTLKEKTAFEWVSPSVRARRDGLLGIEFDGRGLVVIGMDESRGGRQIDHVLVTRFEDSPDSQALSDRLRSFVRHRRPDVHVVLSTPRAVVRHFLIPPIPTRQRAAAAMWEGQKLIPFSLKDGEALFGLDFISAGDRGWWATLVAVPSEDAAPIIDAVTSLDWMLRTVSLIGTQRFTEDLPASTEEATATVSWSDRRGCFSVYHRRQLVFHYDLGPMPAMPAKMELGVVPESMAIWQRWTDSLGAAVSDSLDFHLNVNPTLAPSQLRLYGLPQETAPLLTEWQTRFPGGVIIGDPISACRSALPEGVNNWLSANPGLIAPTMAAMSGSVAVDLTPALIRHTRTRRQRERISRTACILSILACASWSAMIWTQIAGHRTESERAREALSQFQSSPVSIKLDQALAAVAGTQLLVSNASQVGQAWMPWLKTILATLPANANLQHVGMEYRSDKNGVIVHLEGSLGPASIAHSMTYREWFDRLRPLCSSIPVLVSERTIDVIGTKRSAFTIELVAPAALSPAKMKVVE